MGVFECIRYLMIVFAAFLRRESVLQVLKQGSSSPLIRYQYSVPLDVQEGSSRETYAWKTGNWGECTRACAGGKSWLSVWTSNAKMPKKGATMGEPQLRNILLCSLIYCSDGNIQMGMGWGEVPWAVPA